MMHMSIYIRVCSTNKKELWATLFITIGSPLYLLHNNKKEIHLKSSHPLRCSRNRRREEAYHKTIYIYIDLTMKLPLLGH